MQDDNTDAAHAVKTNGRVARLHAALGLGSDASLTEMEFSPPRSRFLLWMIDPGQPVSDAVRARLRAYLFDNIPIWLVGIVNLQFVNALIVWRHPTSLFLGFAFVVFVLDFLRVATLCISLRRAYEGATTPTGLFLTLDNIWLCAVGSASFLVLTTDDVALQLVVVATNIAVSGGLVVRSYVAPRNATLQLVSCLAPLFGAAVFSEATALMALAIQIPVYLWVVSDGAFKINRIFVATMLAEERNQARAESDALTGLANRAVVDSLLPSMCAAPTPQPFALLYLDLDGFKAVNDRHDHQTGDLLLVHVADRLRQAVRVEDCVARLGGDEFVVVMPNSIESVARTRGAEIVSALSRPYMLGDVRVEVGASVGIACGPNGDIDAATLMKQADTALYSAKAAGKGCCMMFSELAPASLGFKCAPEKWARQSNAAEALV